jgi:hypothetical protein
MNNIFKEVIEEAEKVGKKTTIEEKANQTSPFTPLPTDSDQTDRKIIIVGHDFDTGKLALANTLTGGTEFGDEGELISDIKKQIFSFEKDGEKVNYEIAVFPTFLEIDQAREAERKIALKKALKDGKIQQIYLAFDRLTSPEIETYN